MGRRVEFSSMGDFHGLYLWVALTHGHIFSWNMGWQVLRAPRMELLWEFGTSPQLFGLQMCNQYTGTALSLPTAAPDHSLSVSYHIIHFGLICLSWLKSFHFIYSGTPQAGQGCEIWKLISLSLSPAPIQKMQRTERNCMQCSIGV